MKQYPIKWIALRVNRRKRGTLETGIPRKKLSGRTRGVMIKVKKIRQQGQENIWSSK